MNNANDGHHLSYVPVKLLPDGRMDAPRAASYVGLAVKTLANLRSRGLGPIFHKVGRIFYFKEDLDNWIAAGRAQSAAQARIKT
jgi:hypothetical protein